jgi:hypothetical protein
MPHSLCCLFWRGLAGTFHTQSSLGPFPPASLSFPSFYFPSMAYTPGTALGLEENGSWSLLGTLAILGGFLQS